MADSTHDSARRAGGVVGGLGLLLSGIHLFHAVEEFPDEFAAILYGVVLPLAVSLLVLAGGYWLSRQDWSDGSPWRVVRWCGGGLIVGLVLAVLLVQYQIAEQVRLSDRAFVLAMFSTYGSGAGLLVGRYDLERQERHVELRRKTQRLDEFASIVSHDLRNPLNMAQGYIELVRETGDLSHLDPVEDAHDRMESIVRESLAFARQGHDSVTPKPTDLAAVATEAWEMIESADAELRIETDRRILADRARLRAVFENLFRNAIEHNRPSVTVTVGSLEPEPGFYVEDDGDGMPPELHERVFESGFSTTRRGTGLGLSIVRAAADAHGWSLELGTGDAGGARFEIRDVEAVA
ncbi:MAG: sensor histidine kinase [Haloferacaceae archaeon]